MSLRELFAIALCAIGMLGAVERADAASYPPARRGDQVDDYHGEKVADPYRWLEDSDSPESRSWIAAQNRLTSGYLEKIGQRAAIKERLTQLWDYERFGMPVKRGNRYFYTRNDGLQNQAVLYVADALDAQPRVLLDPNTLRADGTAALVIWRPSEDGKLLAYSVAEAGSDWEQLRIRDVASGKDRDDELRWIKWGAAAWSKDGTGLYYGRYDEPSSSEQYRGVNYFHKVYFHKLGEAQSKDRLVHQAGVKEWTFNPIVTEDGRYLILWTWRGSDGTNQVSYRDLQKPDSPVVELIRGFDARYMFVGNEGGRFWFLTDADAPRGRLIEVDIAAPGRANWKTVIPEARETLQRVSLVGDRFIASYLQDAASQVRSFDLSGGTPRAIDAPALSTLGGFEGLRGDPETFYSRTDFTHPGSIYRYDVRTGESTLFRQPKIGFDPNAFETKQVFVTSKDGARVPMFITHRRGLKLDGGNPTVLTGYGGFKISLSPGFSPETLALLEMGGVHAQAGLRGGDEYGQAWHEAGMLGKKQNVFDDFIASAQWLIANGYTRADKLAIRGGSNGGLLVAAAMTQRPELFGAVLCEVGVLDMLRFRHFTIGWAWEAEYGAVDKPGDFRFLRAYSPLHNLRPGAKYPPTLITTADHDDRVAPAHSFKFAAALQHAQARDDAPILIRIETRAGHGQGLPTTKHIELATDALAFFSKTLGMQTPASTAQAHSAEAGEQCAKLRLADFSLTQDAPAEITAANAVEGSRELPSACVVEGVVWPNVRFRVEFPLTGWNGKMLVVGSGGQAGTIMTPAGYDKLRLSGPAMLPRGYAFVGHDSGHSDAGAKWGWHNPSAKIDYGFRAGHVAAVIGKEVLRAFHGRRPARAYYHGCSNGGREALMMAQRYPWDYDGIVAGASSLAYSNLFVHFYAFAELMKDRSRDGFDSRAARVLHDAVLAQCDGIDGKKDGVLEDPRRCKVDFKPVLCTRGAAEECLTQRQADIARRIYEGPRRPDGSQIAPSSAMPGSELTWERWMKLSAYPEEVLRYLAFDPAPGPGWLPDASKLGEYARRMGSMDALFSATNPDLRQFKANGGKLLSYYGWNDSLGGVWENLDYYETVERVMGGPGQTRDFYRLFMVPGMNHCVGGDGVSVFDFIGVLDRWVEQGEAPDVLTGYRPRADGSPEFTRDVPFYRIGAR